MKRKVSWAYPCLLLLILLSICQVGPPFYYLTSFFSPQMKDSFRKIMKTMVKYDTFKAIWPHCIFVSVHPLRESLAENEDGLPCMSQVEQQS